MLRKGKNFIIIVEQSKTLPGRDKFSSGERQTIRRGKKLVCQLELKIYAEILHRSGIGRRGKQRAVHLSVIIGRDGEKLRHCIIGREGELQSFIAAGGLRESCKEIALQSTLIAQRKVKTKIERMRKTIAGSRNLGFGIALLGRAVARANGTLHSRPQRESLEIGHPIAQSDNEIVGACLCEELRSHGKGEHASATHFDLGCKVIVESEIQTEQGGEVLVDRYTRHVVH